MAAILSRGRWVNILQCLSARYLFLASPTCHMGNIKGEGLLMTWCRVADHTVRHADGGWIISINRQNIGLVTRDSKTKINEIEINLSFVSHHQILRLFRNIKPQTDVFCSSKLHHADFSIESVQWISRNLFVIKFSILGNLFFIQWSVKIQLSLKFGHILPDHWTPNQSYVIPVLYITIYHSIQMRSNIWIS